MSLAVWIGRASAVWRSRVGTVFTAWENWRLVEKAFAVVLRSGFCHVHRPAVAGFHQVNLEVGGGSKDYTLLRVATKQISVLEPDGA